MTCEWRTKHCTGLNVRTVAVQGTDISPFYDYEVCEGCMCVEDGCDKPVWNNHISGCCRVHAALHPAPRWVPARVRDGYIISTNGRGMQVRNRARMKVPGHWV